MLELPPLSLGSDDNKTENNEPSYPFAETARWCLGALKNLTRPTKLAPSSSITGKGTSSSVVASQAIIEAGILPLLLRILNSKRYDNTGTIYSWETNSAQDAALYTFLHMTSVPQYRQVLMGDDDDYGCVEVLSSILRYGKVVIGERSLVKDDDGESMCQLNLQCMKAVSWCLYDYTFMKTIASLIVVSHTFSPIKIYLYLASCIELPRPWLFRKQQQFQ